MRSLLMCAAASAAIGATAYGAISPARAEVEYPWCAEMTADPTGSVENCGFTTRAQCESYINGIGGYCQRNLRYPAQPEPRRHRDRYER